jgi:hypothetical protein
MEHLIHAINSLSSTNLIIYGSLLAALFLFIVCFNLGKIKRKKRAYAKGSSELVFLKYGLPGDDNYNLQKR